MTKENYNKMIFDGTLMLKAGILSGWYASKTQEVLTDQRITEILNSCILISKELASLVGIKEPKE